MIEALTTKGEYLLDWIILRKVGQSKPYQVTGEGVLPMPENSGSSEEQQKDTTNEEEILE